jgi:glucose-1-phosphate thymidylyltransferase
MKVIILAAGYAVRLQPLTLNTPKPLLMIGRKTMIDRIVEKVAAVKGWDSIYVITNAKFFDKFDAWRNTARHRDRIAVVNDGSTDNESRLGAIKDIEFVIDRHRIDDDLLVVAGDNLFDLDLTAFIEFARSHSDGASVALYDVGSVELARSYGIAQIDSEHRVVHFEEKPPVPKSTLSSTGIYYFPKNKLSFIKKYVKMQNKLDAPGYYIGWLSGLDRVYGYKFLEDWYDIGTIESYKKADEKYKNKERE